MVAVLLHVRELLLNLVELGPLLASDFLDVPTEVAPTDNRFSNRKTCVPGMKGSVSRACRSTAVIRPVKEAKLHRELNITQRSAWFLAHRLRKTWTDDGATFPFAGPSAAPGRSSPRSREFPSPVLPATACTSPGAAS